MELARKHPSPRGQETKDEENEEGIPQESGWRDAGPAGIADKEKVTTEPWWYSTGAWISFFGGF